MTASKSKLRVRGASKPGPKVSADIRKMLQTSVRDDLILTPALENFLVQWDGVVPDWVAEIIADVMKKPQRNRSGSWSASAAGKCLRRQEFTFLGMPVVGQASMQGQQILNNGSWVHMRFQATLLTAGLLDNVEWTWRKPSQRARCTLDGIGHATVGRFVGREFGFELKGRNDWVYNSQVIKGVDEVTRKQVDFEFLLTGLDVFVILNENKNNQAMKEWVFVRNPERVRDMATQIKELNRAIDKQRLHPMLPECKKQDKNGEFFKCPFGGPGGVCANSGSWPS